MDVSALLAQQATNQRPSCAVPDQNDDGTTHTQLDLGHLASYDPAPIPHQALSDSHSLDEYLAQRARTNTQRITNALYQLLADAKSKSAIVLPPPTLLLPREKPLPAPKPLTRWEKFAAEKGIVKKKRSKNVWDEERQIWAPRYGYGRANDPNDKMKNWLVEVKPGDDPNVDPFEEKASARKAARSKQKMQEERNRLEAAHAAGLVSRGKPVAAFARAKSDKAAYLDHGIKAVQSSTASVGRFDRQLDKEPSRTKGQRRSYGSDTVAEHRASDASSAKRVAERIFPDASSDRSKRAEVVRSSSTALKMARRDEESANRKAKRAAAMKKPVSKRGKPALSGAVSKGKGKGKVKVGSTKR